MNSSYISKPTRLIYSLSGALSGGVVLCLFSVFQKLLIGAPIFNPRGYIVPAVFGSLFGLLIALLYYQQIQTYLKLEASHKKYKNLFEELPIGSCQISPGGRILIANTAALRILHYPDIDTLLKANLKDIFVSHDDYQEFLSLVEHSQGIKQQDCQIRTYDGIQRWVQFHGHPHGEKREPLIYTLNFSEITQQKQLTEQLIKLRQAVLNTQDVVFMTDPEGTIVFINPAFTKVYGYTADEVVNQVTPRILKSGQMTLDDYELLWQCLLTRQTFAGELINKTKDNRYLHIEASANAILDEDGHIMGFLAIQRDVSQYKEALEQLERHTRQMEIMRKIDHAILRETSPQRIATGALEEIEGLVLFLRVSITLYDFAAGEFLILAAKAQGKTALSVGMSEPLSKAGIDFNELRQNGFRAVEDINRLDTFTPITEQLKKEGVQSFINVALMIKGELIGSLNLANDTPHTYTTEEISILGDVATQLAIALHQAQLKQKTEQQRWELATLLEISQELATSIEFESVLQLAVERAVRTVKMDTGAIYVLEDDHLYLGATTPPIPPDMPRELRIAYLQNHPHVSRAISTKEPVYVSDSALADLTPQEKEVIEARGLRTLLYLPLPTGQRMTGVLIVGTTGIKRAFSEEEIRLCQTIATQIAFAVDNARMHYQLQRHAGELEMTIAKRTEALEAANQQLEALSRVKDEFVSNVSHELRTPITTLKLFHSLSKQNPDKQQEYYAKIDREIDRLSLLIEDLLRLSRLDQEYAEFEYLPIDLNLLVMEYIEDRRVIAQEKDLALDLVTPSRPIIVQADKGILGQVISILLTNAFNYTPDGGQVEVRLEKCQGNDAGWVCIHFSDTGLGVTPEELSDVFNRFYRGTAGRQSKAPGTGLGLSLAQEIIKRHQGRIELYSPGRLGTGTTVTVWLPLAS